MSDPTKTSGSMTVEAPFQITGRPKASERWLKLLVYADPGVGKTTLAGSAVDVPQMNDVLFVDAESGQMTLDDNDRIQASENIDRIRITKFSQVAYILDFLKAHCAARDANNLDKLRELESRVKGGKPEDYPEPRKYRTVILDSLSEINEYCMYDLLNIDDTTKLDPNKMDVAEWPEFRKNNQMMQLLTRAYRDLPMNVIFVCSAQYTQDELKRKFFAPNITGKLSNQVQGFMDIVGYLRSGAIPEGAEEAPRRLYVQPTGNFAAKNRRSKFKKAYFDNPTMLTMLKDLGLYEQS